MLIEAATFLAAFISKGGDFAWVDYVDAKQVCTIVSGEEHSRCVLG